ncbi:MAG: CAP domain-containing protein [Lachnospiraceae bacterium]|nr:CAP domain-containing protein [Lachnospiraceae bacterium]
MTNGQTKKAAIVISILTVFLAFAFCNIEAQARTARTITRGSASQEEIPCDSIVPAVVRHDNTPANAAVSVSVTFSYEDNTLKAEILHAQNAYRAQAGLSAYHPTLGLDQAAQIRADEMVASGCFSHTRPDGTFCFTVSPEAYGENLYTGPQQAARGGHIAEMFYHSPSHYANMMDGGFATCGIGIAIAPDGTVYCAIEYGY